MYYHQMNGEELGFRFRPFKALRRFTTVTKSSFKLKNIMGALGSLTATVATGGLGPIIAPKVFSANSATMKSLGMAVTAIAVVAGAVVLGPAIAASLGPMLSSAAGIAGKAVTGMTTFMKAFNFLSPAKRQQMASELTPQQIADVETGRASLTEQGLSYDNQPPGSLRVNGETVPAGYGYGQSSDNATLSQGGSFGSINPLYLVGGGVALVAVMMMQQRR